MEHPPRTVLFADVSDSTSIYESLGDAQALPFINRLLAHLDKRIAACGGVMVKHMGDGLVCHFAGPDDASRAACQMQTVAQTLSAGFGPKLGLKVALAHGPVISEQEDVFGDTVNVSARLAALAKPGQILTTQQTVEALSPVLKGECRRLYQTRVRGRKELVEVHQILWESDPDLTRTDFPRPTIVRSGGWQLKMVYAGETYVLQAPGELRIGRDGSNHVMVPSARASRLHARVFERDGNFVLADVSVNGTYVLTDGQPKEVVLQRQELVLGERGWLGLGGSASTHGDHVLRFRLERAA